VPRYLAVGGCYRGEVYWDPLPIVATSARLPVANLEDDSRLGPPADYLGGEWDRRDWRNVPGPFYGAQTDSCWTGREIAPRHIVYEDECGGEVVFRQPRDAGEVHLLLTAAWNDPFRAYASDGDDHWTLAMVREWWAGRARIVAWIEDVRHRWSASERSDERDNAVGLRDYASYLDNGLEAYLRAYGFWLDNRRAATPGDTLPDLS
jgi:hypothetical protein